MYDAVDEGEDALVDAVEQAGGAIREATEALKGLDPKTPKWVVALTDGKDTDSAASDVQRAADAFRSTKQLNFAFISLGNEVDRPKIDQMVKGAKDGGNEGIVASANSMAEVQAAFSRIAEAITVPTGGAM